MNLFISKETLDLLSYQSTLGRSLKQISLSATPIDMILDDIAKYRAGYIDTLVQENLIGSALRVRIPLYGSIRKQLPTTVALSSVLMMCLVFDFALMSIRKATRTIFVWSI